MSVQNPFSSEHVAEARSIITEYLALARPPKETVRMSVAEFRANIGPALELAHYANTAVEITKHGKPFACVLDEESADRLQALDDLVDRFNKLADLEPSPLNLKARARVEQALVRFVEDPKTIFAL